MAKVRAYTTIKQSRKLAEILPLESADMGYNGVKNRDIRKFRYDDIATTMPNMDSIPCWSLAALLGVLPKSGKYEPFIDIRYNRIEYHAVDDEITDKDYLLCYTDGCSLLDACYEMIIKLNELNLI